ncbi:recombinase family protein [Streptomyces atratus]|uniref:recombinase family protein n=1 Tax=Streptomyces atratus TaxID=1893 RepID=UPI002109824A|nr:recombinase family protein [Streptomyces atratus]
MQVIRLSVLTDETTSPARQRAATDRVAAEMSIVFDGRMAEDLDVSASKTAPFDRPALGKWLRRPDEFDALVWWRFDRAIRSMGDMYELAKWAREHRKMLVFSEGVGGGSKLVFDFRNPMDPIAELMMVMFAFAAQVESMSISDRVTGAQAAMRLMPLRFRGGQLPYGYMTAPLASGGFTLVPDPEAVKVIERIIRELMEMEAQGDSRAAIASRLNVEGIPSPRDYRQIKQGRATGGKVGKYKRQHERYAWQAGTITRMLRSPTLIGWKMHDGNPVRDPEGRPVMLTENPILTRSEFDTIGALLDRLGNGGGPTARSDTHSMLLHVIHCPSCSGFMYQSRPGGGRPRGPGESYTCRTRANGGVCEEPSTVKSVWADDYVEREFLKAVGDLPVTEVRETAGYDPEPEIEATMREFEAHQEQQGQQRSKAAAAAWQRRADALDARLEELESTPRIEPKREIVATGKTYRDSWPAMPEDISDVPDEEIFAINDERRRMLLAAGAKLTVKKGPRGGWRKLDESRCGFAVSTANQIDPAASRLAEIEAEESIE